MRHGKKIAKLGRTSSHRKAMLGNMVTSLFEHEAIRTTDTRAKELRRTADRLITLAKRGDLHARRQILRVIPNKRVVAKIIESLATRYRTRNGGYTRIVKLGPRRGDAAEMCIIELVDRPGVEEVVEEQAKAEAVEETQESQEPQEPQEPQENEEETAAKQS
jgi:large subunit ribosomal protein L17